MGRLLFFVLASCTLSLTIHADPGSSATGERDGEGGASRPAFRLSTKSPSRESPSKAVDAPHSQGDAAKADDTIEEGAIRVGVVEGKPKLPPELRDLAREATLAAAAQDWERARDKYLEMVERAPGNELAYANLGVAEHQLGNRLAATANLEKSLSINPSIAENWQTLGLIQYENGDLPLAISSLMRAIHAVPGDATSRLVLAAVLRDYGWEKASVVELRRALDIDPKLPDAHYNLALAYLSESPPRVELARRHYYAAIDLGAEPSEEMDRVFSPGDR